MKIKLKFKRTAVLLTIIFASLSAGCYLEGRDNIFDPESDVYIGRDPKPKATAWTIMVFMGADNNLEEEMLEDINEMQQGMKNVEGLNLIVFIDRSRAYSSDYYVLGENFSGGKIFRVAASGTYELYGQEFLPECRPQNFYDVNSGDAEILKKFIQFGKAYYPADKYGLIISSHGGGAMKRSVSSTITKSIDGSSPREVSGDYPAGDWLYTAEITDVLTADESVDFLGYDACFMGSAELAYQYRPGNGSFSADVIAASPASEWGPGWDFSMVFSRIKRGGGISTETADIVKEDPDHELFYDPVNMTAMQLGGIIVEEYYDQWKNSSSYLASQTMSCYDLSRAANMKQKIDGLVVELSLLPGIDIDDILGLGLTSKFESSATAMHFFETDSEITSFPFFDVYDLAARIQILHPGTDIDAAAEAVKTAVDDTIVYSFGGSNYVADTSYSSGGTFQKGKNGIHIYYPLASDFKTYGLWYSPLDTSSLDSDYKGYGKLSWCIDGATQNNGAVENWFELLDDWMDAGNTNNYTP